ncbi:MAG: PHP-associated domain-containing protein [Candidatus Binatia bacterium]
MLRADLHHHIDADPMDGHFVRHSAGELIDRAAALGLNVLAITCHESVPYDGDATRYAAARGVLLLRGMEATVDGYHLLLLNFPEFPPGVCTMADVVRRKTSDALVVAPHPLYPVGMGIGPRFLQQHAGIDAVEFSGLYTKQTPQFNRRAAAHARRANLPVVGNSDTHFLWQLGHTFTLIDAPADRTAVVDAIRRGHVEVVTQPLSWIQVVRFVVQSRATRYMLRESVAYMAQILRRTGRRNR